MLQISLKDFLCCYIELCFQGMRIAMTDSEFLSQLESAKRESLKSFGDESMLLEQYITDPRHVEVQVRLFSHITNM